MPKQTFFHLSPEKQNKLLQSAKEEFSRVPLHEASIANIIKKAGIPRGSFYQYFADKEDLFYYLLHQLSQKNFERFVTLLQEKDGDLFATCLDFFRLMVKDHKSQEHKNFFRNAFSNMNYRLEKTLASNVYEENQKSQNRLMMNMINRKHLNVKDDQELHHLIKIITAITFHNLVQTFAKDLTEEEALQNYRQQMEMVKRGLYLENGASV
ncbi:TetR/AcrR family transcriptional regulator [Brevibacillus fulvus]|uniref:AcrR family transcriptional regulator n=1 Tax=Brevibacillus fulvus TaxID=1125967 RepID=A0A938Y1F9_9BACL|nr:TetR family transcriptional regulator [Brevibacillus fulvus]MBM7591560.1 AcrR family transcriptional regulator [Brevibacillus fulvus]